MKKYGTYAIERWLWAWQLIARITVRCQFVANCWQAGLFAGAELNDGDMSDLHCARVPAAAVIDLRHRVLRHGMPRAAAIFDGDETALHYAVLRDEEVLVCLSLMAVALPEGDPAITNTYQLRGMASADVLRGQGWGRRLMAFMEEDLQPQLLWCNARVTAIAFYEKCGWQVISEEFDIPHAGPHVRMKKALVSL